MLRNEVVGRQKMEGLSGAGRLCSMRTASPRRQRRWRWTAANTEQRHSRSAAATAARTARSAMPRQTCAERVAAPRRSQEETDDRDKLRRARGWLSGGQGRTSSASSHRGRRCGGHDERQHEHIRGSLWAREQTLRLLHGRTQKWSRLGAVDPSRRLFSQRAAAPLRASCSWLVGGV